MKQFKRQPQIIGINRPQIKRKIYELLRVKLGLEDDFVIEEKHSISNDLGADSLDGVEIIMELEKEFNIQIEDDDAEQIYTVGEMIDFFFPLTEIRREKLKAIKKNV